MRRFLSLLILFFICTFIIEANAHSGGTDEFGGHMDYDTGEYHYHHGYPEHSHYDMDGDGDLDCPYDFNDKTGVNSGSNGSSTKDNSYDSYSYSRWDTVSSTPPEATNQIMYEGDQEVPSWVYWVFAGQAVAIICLLISNGAKKDTIQIMESRHRAEIDAVNKACEARITEKNALDAELETIRSNIVDAQKIHKALLVEQNDLLDQISHQNREILKLRHVRCWAKEAPLDISFAKDGLPIYWKPHMTKPYGDYTVYTNEKARIYHVDRLCASYQASERHIFHVIERYRPCRKCAEGFFDFAKPPDWYTGMKTPAEEHPNSIMVNWRDQ